MSFPLIGLTTSRSNNARGHPTVMVMEAYVRALAQVGAAPVLIPLGLAETALLEVVSRLDGVLFTGGGDVAPERYGSLPHPLVASVDADRDRVEIALFHRVLLSGLPFLGICRGLQLVNVAMGGTLYEDILDQREGAMPHQYADEGPRDYLAHTVQIEGDSRLSQITHSTTQQVNSLHHQGIHRLAPGLRASAYAPDGLVEAVELPGAPFGLAVQWHPEWLPGQAASTALFAAFTSAAARSQDE